MWADGDAIPLEHILEMYPALPKANLLVMPATRTGCYGKNIDCLTKCANGFWKVLLNVV